MLTQQVLSKLARVTSLLRLTPPHILITSPSLTLICMNINYLNLICMNINYLTLTHPPSPSKIRVDRYLYYYLLTFSFPGH
jgi:hypothetical protein